MEEFFSHENQSTPASLSDDGHLHTTQKSQLTDILQKQTSMPETEPHTDTIIIDGSALVNSTPPKVSKTFNEYVQEDTISKLASYASKYDRIDIVFDVYKKDSLKSETRSKRGSGIRRRVSATSKTPTNWKGFLRDDNNKTELFAFFPEKICSSEAITNLVIATKGPLAITNSITKSLDAISPCSHEEADTRLFVHARDAVLNGSQSLIIKANDTDVLVIAIFVLSSLQNLGLQQMWVFFGHGPFTKWIPVHEVVAAIGQRKALGILYFHAFTGCDVVSAFRGKGKKSAWLTWDVCDEVTETFVTLSQIPSEVCDEDLINLERFVTLLTTGQVRSHTLIKQDWSCLLESKSLMMPYHHHVLRCLSMRNVPPTKQESSGRRQLSRSRTSVTLPTGAGLEKRMRGKLCGRLSHRQLHAVCS